MRFAYKMSITFHRHVALNNVKWRFGHFFVEGANETLLPSTVFRANVPYTPYIQWCPWKVFVVWKEDVDFQAGNP